VLTSAKAQAGRSRPNPHAPEPPPRTYCIEPPQCRSGCLITERRKLIQSEQRLSSEQVASSVGQSVRGLSQGLRIFAVSPIERHTATHRVEASWSRPKAPFSNESETHPPGLLSQRLKAGFGGSNARPALRSGPLAQRRCLLVNRPAQLPFSGATCLAARCAVPNSRLGNLLT